MQINDHMLIAKYLFNEKNYNDFNLKRKAFVLGCIQPDFNPLTYLKGSFNNKILHGHNFKNSFNFLKRKITTLKKKDKLRLKDYYNLGKIIHYLVDDFTYPHNSDFPENVIEHRKYEKELHEVFEEYLKNENKVINFSYLSKEEIIEYIVNNHDEYVEVKPTFLRDCKYILSVCISVLNAFESEEYQLVFEAA